MVAVLAMCACAAQDRVPSSDPSPEPDSGNTQDSGAASSATEITLESPEPLAMVAYRDVDDPVWHTATEITSGHFVAQVHGAYWLTTVCQGHILDVDTGVESPWTVVWRAGRTLDEAHEVDFPFSCAPAGVTTPSPRVTGTMLQASDQIGNVALGNDKVSTVIDGETAQMSYSLAVPEGTYTMYGYNADRIAIRHGVEVTRSVTEAPLDLASEGQAYDLASLNITNADPAGQPFVVTRIADANSQDPFQVISSELPAKVVPAALMTTDNQTVSAQVVTNEFIGNTSRAVGVASRRPWRTGDDPTFVEPAPITGATWTFDDRGQLIARWQALPVLTIYRSEASAVIESAGNVETFIDDFTDLSPGFLAATGATSVVHDTGIPGFDPRWRIPYSSTSYRREQLAQNVTDLTRPGQSPIYSSRVTEHVPPASLAGRVTLQLPSAPQRAGTMPYPR